MAQEYGEAWKMTYHERNGKWTDKAREKIGELWMLGQSASVIAEQMGGVTRNSIIGVISRLGLKRQIPAISQATNKRPTRIQRAKTAKPIANIRITPTRVFTKPAPPKPLPAVVIEEGSLARPWETRKWSGECKWPIDRPDGLYSCCEPCEGTYCRRHSERAFVKR